MPNSPAKEETKLERAEREAHERLENPDMDLFDRFMKKLIDIPRERLQPFQPKQKD
jgi:hypothetical protein